MLRAAGEIGHWGQRSSVHFCTLPWVLDNGKEGNNGMYFTSTRTSFCEERIGRSLGLLLLSTDSACGM